MSNLKPVELPRRCTPVHVFAADVTGEVTLVKRPQKRFRFFLLALRDQLNAAIRQVAHEPSHFIAARYLAHAVPKSNALYPT
jgi:hypothetical protein